MDPRPCDGDGLRDPRPSAPAPAAAAASPPGFGLDAADDGRDVDDEDEEELPPMVRAASPTTDQARDTHGDTKRRGKMEPLR